ncbi:MAG: glycosyltransferase family 39 protein [Pseudomonadota bacterium]
MRDILICVALFAVALIVRLVMIGNPELHIDEYHSINYARQSLATLFALDRDTDIHPPMFFVTVKAWAALFGEERLAMRALPAVLSALAVPLFYVILRQFIDWKTAALAGLLFCVAPMQVFYGRFIRMYPLLTLFYLIAFFCYLKSRKEVSALLDPRGATPWLVALGGLSLTLAFMTHYTAAFSFVCFALIAVVQYLRGRPGEFWVIVAMLAIGTLLAVPQMLHMLSQMGSADMSWMKPTTPRIFYVMSMGAYPFAFYLKPVMAAVMLWGAWQLWQHDRDMAIRIGIFMLAGPAVAAVVGIWHPIYLVRTIQVFTIFSSLLMALAVMALIARPAVAGVLAAVCLFANVQALAPRYPIEREANSFETHAALVAEIDAARDRPFVFFNLHREARYRRADWFADAVKLRHDDRLAHMAEIEAAAAACFGASSADCRSVVIFAETTPLYQKAAGAEWEAFLEDLTARYPVAYDVADPRLRVVVLAEDGRFPVEG